MAPATSLPRSGFATPHPNSISVCAVVFTTTVDARPRREILRHACCCSRCKRPNRDEVDFTDAPRVTSDARCFAAITPKATPIRLDALTDNVTNECGVTLPVRVCLLKNAADPATEAPNPAVTNRFRLGPRAVP